MSSLSADPAVSTTLLSNKMLSCVTQMLVVGQQVLDNKCWPTFVCRVSAALNVIIIL